MIVIDTFAIQDRLYQVFTNDVQLMTALGCSSDEDLKNIKFLREGVLPETVKPEWLPFLTLAFVASLETGNCKQNKGVLELNIYSRGRIEAMNIYRLSRQLTGDTLTTQIVYEAQVPTAIPGMYLYRVRYKVQVNS